MRNFIIGLFLGIILTGFTAVYLFQQCHLLIEKKEFDMRKMTCVMFDEAIQKTYGNPMRNIFYVTFKIFDYPLKKIGLLEEFFPEDRDFYLLKGE